MFHVDMNRLWCGLPFRKVNMDVTMAPRLGYECFASFSASCLSIMSTMKRIASNAVCHKVYP